MADKAVTVIVGLFILSALLQTAHAANDVPDLKVKDLTGRELTLPRKDVSAVYVVSFSRQGSRGVEKWLEELEQVPVLYTVAVLEGAPWFVRRMIRSAVRRDLTEEEYPYFVIAEQGRDEWIQMSGSTDDALPVVVCHDPERGVISSVEGEFSETLLKQLPCVHNPVSMEGETEMNEANLTRFGPKVYDIAQGEATNDSASFKAVNGPGRLVVQHSAIEGAQIRVNNVEVVGPQDVSGTGEVVVPVNLEKDNIIEVGASGEGVLSIRVTQVTQADLGVLRQGYFGLNTSDMERQRAFYDTLGFTGEIYPAGPETSTTFARSLGFADNYLIYVALTSLEDPPVPPFVDTVQFRGDSYREEPPYAHLNHIGMAYATYSTTDLDGDYAYLLTKGVEFVSAPTQAPDGERFVFLKDQDGAFLKLIQADEGEPSSSRPNLVRLVNTNMNVADLERSREFYRLVGFTESEPRSQSGSGDFSAAHGFAGPIEFEGVDISLGAGTDGATLQLRQWQTPYDDAPPYAPPVNHLGIDRINFYVEDLSSTIRTMNELGFEQLGPIGGGPDIAIVFFYDPDGIKVQFAGPITDQE